MAAPPAASLRRSSPASSSLASSKRSYREPQTRGDDDGDDEHDGATSIPVDTLVNHLLSAKRSLSSMTLVLRANELANTAGSTYEDAAILAAQAGFLRSSILDQAAILVKVRRSLQATYDWGKRDFKKLVKAMDEVDGELGDTMSMLRDTQVQGTLKLEDQERKTLLDFVDETSVHGMREAMKKSIVELQGTQQSFDGDLQRLDTDVRNLKKIIIDSPNLQTGGDDESSPQAQMAEILFSMVDHSSNMGQLLASLTNHFDMCVTAIRTTEGAAALARRKAAEVTQSKSGSSAGPGESVSISGVIAEQESNNMSDLEPKTAADRAEMLRVVVQDADEVDDVVQEIQDRLAAVQQDATALDDFASQTKMAYVGMLAAQAELADISDRLADYLAAEDDFRTRWDLEKETVFAKLREMKEMRDFYEGYASAYDSLVLEVERRRGVDDRVQGIWRKAQESVDKILEADRVARDTFRQDVGEFLPTDLWAGMQGPVTTYKVIPTSEDEPRADQGGGGDAVTS